MKNVHHSKTEYLCYNGPIGDSNPHNHLKLKIGVSGANETGICGVHAFDQGKELGREIVRQGGVLVTGATHGFPLWAAMGAKEEKGVSIGISPAANEHEHARTYRLPLEYMDLIIYTGFGFTGGDLLFTRSCDAVIFGCGRIGSIHEFTVAFQEGTPIGVLEGEWPTSQIIRDIIAESSNRSSDHVVFAADPSKLIEKVIALVVKKKEKREVL